MEAIAAIYVKAARAGWASIFDEQSLKAAEPPVARLRAEFASTDPRRRVLVAESDGRVIAFAVLRPSQDEDADGIPVGELDQFYSDPAVWGQVAGRKLLAASFETLRENGFTEATLWVAAENHRPRQIYEAAGWTSEVDHARQVVAREERSRSALPNQALAEGATAELANRLTPA